jgi:hypothetical protein
VVLPFEQAEMMRMNDRARTCHFSMLYPVFYGVYKDCERLFDTFISLKVQIIENGARK